MTARRQARMRKAAKIGMRGSLMIGSEIFANFGQTTARCRVLGLADWTCSCGSPLFAIEMTDGSGSGLVCANRLIRIDAAPHGFAGVA